MQVNRQPTVTANRKNKVTTQINTHAQRHARSQTHPTDLGADDVVTVGW